MDRAVRSDLTPEPDIGAERIRLLFKQTKPTLLISPVVAVVLALVLWSHTDHFWLLAWLGALVVTALLRAVVILAFQGGDPTDFRRWEAAFVVAAGLGGVAWGAMALLAELTPSPLYQMFILLTLAGNCVGAVAAYAASYRSYLAFLMPALGPLIVWGLLRQESVGFGIAGLTTLFAILLAVTALNFHRNLIESLRMRRQNLLFDAEIRLAATVFENSLQGVIITDCEEHIVKINPAATEITGYVADEAIGRVWSDWLTEEHVAAHHETVRFPLDANGKWEGEAVYRCKDGALRPVWQTITSAVNQAGEVIGRIVIFGDNSERKRAEDRISRLAYQDALTGLSNRHVFEDRLGHAIERSRRHGVRFAVLFVDLCRFRSVNDSLGYSAGDELLKATAKRLQRRLRSEDTLTRLEGDKFGLILEAIVTAGDAETVAQSVVRGISEPLQLSGGELAPACCIGIAICPDDGNQVAALMETVDMALHQAEKRGENTFCFYSSTMSHEASERLALERALRRGIDRNELVLHYQPQYSIGQRRTVGVEALVRWEHPERGLLAPGRFIGVAEESKLIVPLSRWVLRRAVSDWRALTDAGRPLRLSVNVSAQQFPEPDFVASVAEALRDCDMPPEQLELEITESVLVRDIDAATAILRDLKALGLRVAIDDFGTGYSSLSYIANLPIDTIKIDQTFIRDIDTSESHRALVKAILQMCQALELEVVAEGVETEAEAVALRRLGGDLFQGYLFSKPLPKELLPEIAARKLPITLAA